MLVPGLGRNMKREVVSMSNDLLKIKIVPLHKQLEQRIELFERAANVFRELWMKAPRGVLYLLFIIACIIFIFQ